MTPCRSGGRGCLRFIPTAGRGRWSAVGVWGISGRQATWPMMTDSSATLEAPVASRRARGRQTRQVINATCGV